MEKKRNDLTELVFILDRSGSMAGLESDTIGGFNGLIDKQKKVDGKAFVTTVLFDNQQKTVHDRIDLAEVAPMTEKEYYVGGSTALLDAVGDTVTHIEKIHKYVRPEDVPAHTMVVITTDGMENSSHRWRGLGVPVPGRQHRRGERSGPLRHRRGQSGALLQRFRGRAQELLRRG